MTTKAVARAVRAIDGVIIKETDKEMFAMAHGYDIEVVCGHILTVRKTAKRGYYDAGSDYNPGGYIFLNRIKDIKTFVVGNNA